MPGDAKGGRDIWLGTLSKEECIKACLKKKQESDYSINGLTVYADIRKRGCWCNKWMSHRDTDTKWESCFLKDPLPEGN